MESIHTEREAKRQLAERLLVLEAQSGTSPNDRKLELDRLLSQVCLSPERLSDVAFLHCLKDC